MARTLIGELILRLKDEMSGKAKSTAGNVTSSLDAIDRAAKRLSSSPWDSKFQVKLDKLKASSKDLDIFKQSWVRLQDEMQKKSLSKSLRGIEISNWKSVILSNLTAVQLKARATNAELKRLKNLGGSALKPLLVAAGGYTGAYVAGIGVRAAINSASMQQRERAKQHYAGLPTSEQATIEKMSQELSAKYRTSQTAAMEIMREARLAMPSADAAFGVAEEMIQAYKMLSMSLGPDQAIGGLRSFNKAMDNLNVTENGELYKEYLNNYIKAQMITGKDMDPESYALAVKYSRTSGKVFSPDFMQKYLPFLIAENNGADAGGSLNALYNQLVGSKTPKGQKKEQTRLDLRNEDGSMVDRDGFTNNPIKWIEEHLIPALAKDGVDMDNEGAVAEATTKIFGNIRSTDMANKMIIGRAVYERLVDMMEGAIGLEGANDIDMRDPFSAFQGFKDSFANLAAALIPIDSISAGLVTFSNAINTLANAFKNSEDWAKYTVGGVGAAVAGAGAYGIGKSFSSLLAAGPTLLAAGNVLLKAGLAQGVDVDIGGGKGGKGKSLLAAALGLITRIPSPVAAAAGVGYIAYEQSNPDPRYATPEGANRAMSYDKAMHGVQVEGGMHRLGLERDAGFGPVVQQSVEAGAEIKANLSPTGAPQIDVSGINNALNLARQLATVLGGIPALAVQAGASADSAIRQSHSDFGGEAAP